MAYDKAKRFEKLITQTPPDIGPGTYDISELPRSKNHLADVYPFLCGAKRRTIIVAKDVERLPAPGSYNGGVSIDFTDARFKEHVSEGPGPIFNLATDLLKSRKMRSHPCSWRGPAGKLWLTRPPRSIVPSPTTVPHKLYAGYGVNEYGNLVKNLPIKHKPKMFYDIPREETNTTTLLYKGNFWSRKTGRTEPPISLTPGPGDYEHETRKTPIQIQNEKVKEGKRMTCRQTRFLDAMQRKEMRENFPGPNCYKIKGSFERFMKIDCKCDPYTLEPPPFGQTAKFEDNMQSDVPGPGTYDPPTKIKCVGSIYPAPFGVCAGRFKKDTEDTRPGPSDYNLVVGNLAYESQKRFKYSCMRKSRPQVSVDSVFIFDDGPDHERTNIKETTVEPKSNIYHAAFKSRKDRFPKPDKMDVPDPGAYEVITAFKANRDKCDFHCRRLAPPFGTRSARISKEMFGSSAYAPDPTSYKVAGDISKGVKGGVISAGSRSQETAAAPPPNRYCIHPYLASSVTKKSYNILLGKSELEKKLEMQGRKLPFRSRCPCKKKNLRWFAISLHENRHCKPVSF